MSLDSLSKREARQVLIQSHFKGGSALDTIKHLGYVQIDTIHVVERAHHHILFSRNAEYRPAVLHDLQRKRKVFEYWTHALSYLPIESFRFFIPRMRDYEKDRKAWWQPVSSKDIKLVLNRIEKEGALDLSAFEVDPRAVKRHPWASKKPSKATLEYLFHAGRLMISERKGMRKTYDLTERVLPQTIDVRVPEGLEVGRYLIQSALSSQVFLNRREMSYLRDRYRSEIDAAREAMLEEGVLKPIQIEGQDEIDYVMRMPKLKSGNVLQERVQLLSPFDPLVIQRQRLKRLFDFDYTLECYVPAAKRKQGYFCMPVLYGAEFVGVIDLKADRASGELQVAAFSLQHPERVKSRARFREALTRALKEMLEFQGCGHVSGLEKLGRG